jgi:GT2 family glycosyltransferase
MNDITVILNGYKRPQFLQEQINAIQNQTVKPREIMLWQNNTEGFDQNITNSITTAASNKNLGVWARFAYALNAKTEYICIFDDDTIPGSKWFENCLETMKTHEGLLGTIG